MQHPAFVLGTHGAVMALTATVGAFCKRCAPQAIYSIRRIVLGSSPERLEASMTDDRQHRIRQRAHAIWESQGRPHGQDREHWDQATREVDAADVSASRKKPAGAAATTKPKAPAKAPAKKAPATKAKPKSAK
jgi:hypothetical protein